MHQVCINKYIINLIGNKYIIMKTNIIESMNKVSKYVKELPICTLVEFLISVLVISSMIGIILHPYVTNKV